jgi:hypothetical protein
VTSEIIDLAAQIAERAKQTTATSEPETHTWQPVDLTAVLDGTYERPQATVGKRDDGVGMFYPGRQHSLYSESEGGKTWLALSQAAVELNRGNAVLYLDFEDDEGGVVGRLLAFGVSRDSVRNRLAYIRPEEPVGGAGNRIDLDAALGDLSPTFTVIDGVTEAMVMHGLNPLDNADVARFGRLVPGYIAGRGPATLSLDHVVKDREGRGRYAIGGVHKLNGLNGAAYTLENRKAFGIGMTGRSTVYVAKDRPGQLRRHSLPGTPPLFWFADFVLTSLDATSVEASVEVPVERTDFRPTVLMGRVSEALSRASEPLSVRGILDRVTGKQEAIRAAIAALVDDGYVSTESGPRGAVLHRLVKPYGEPQ